MSEIKHEFYTCSYCGNDYTIEQGYNLETKQCPPCDDWDKQKPERDAAWEEYKRIQELPTPNFPYVAGDPYW